MKDAGGKHRRFSDIVWSEMTERKVFGKKHWIRTLLVQLLVCVCLLSGVAQSAAASETEEKKGIEKIRELRECIVHIESACWNGESEIYRTKAFSGFVAAKDNTGIYVVTVHDGLTFTSEEKEAIKTEQNLEKNVRISEKLEVVFSGDLRVKASIVGESEQRNLTVLKLDQSIHFDNALSFSKESILDNTPVYLLSYPESIASDSGSYNMENVLITSGTLLNSYYTDEISFCYHDISADSYSAGGPLLDAEGLVAGVLLTSKGETEGTAISADSLKDFLNTFNITYQEYEEVVPKKKLPIVNILLGIVIAVLFVNVVRQSLRNTAVSEKEPKVSGSGKKKKVSGPEAKTMASVEYPAEKRSAVISKSRFVLGRSPESEFRFADSKGISRKHACIQYDGKDFYLSDLGSTNHTFLNGQELVPGDSRRLKNDDEIMVGNERLIFHMK